MLHFAAFIAFAGKVRWRNLDVLRRAASLIRTVLGNHGTVAQHNDRIQNSALFNVDVVCQILEQNSDARSIRLRWSPMDSLCGTRTLKISKVSLVAVTMWTEVTIAWAIWSVSTSPFKNLSLINLRASVVPTAAKISKIHFLKVTTNAGLSEKARLEPSALFEIWLSVTWEQSRSSSRGIPSHLLSLNGEAGSF